MKILSSYRYYKLANLAEVCNINQKEVSDLDEPVVCVFEAKNDAIED